MQTHMISSLAAEESTKTRYVQATRKPAEQSQLPPQLKPEDNIDLAHEFTCSKNNFNDSLANTRDFYKTQTDGGFGNDFMGTHSLKPELGAPVHANPSSFYQT